MKGLLTVIVVAMAVPFLGQNRSNKVEEEILKLEEEFGKAMTSNDAETLERLLADDWVIIDADGGTIDRSRFLGVIKSGAFIHETMDSDDVEFACTEIPPPSQL